MICFFKQVIFRFQLLIFQGCKHPNPRIHNPSLRLRSPPPRPRSRRTDLGLGSNLEARENFREKTAGHFYGFDHDAKVVQPPTQDSSHHQDYYIFNKKNPKQQNPSCTTATGRGGGATPKGEGTWQDPLAQAWTVSSSWWPGNLLGAILESYILRDVCGFTTPWRKLVANMTSWEISNLLKMYLLLKTGTLYVFQMVDFSS